MLPCIRIFWRGVSISWDFINKTLLGQGLVQNCFPRRSYCLYDVISLEWVWELVTDLDILEMLSFQPCIPRMVVGEHLSNNWRVLSGLMFTLDFGKLLNWFKISASEINQKIWRHIVLDCFLENYDCSWCK